MDLFLHRHAYDIQKHTSYQQMAMSAFLEQGAGRALMEQLVRTPQEMDKILEDGFFVQSVMSSKHLDVWEMVVEALAQSTMSMHTKWHMAQGWVMSFFQHERDEVFLSMLDRLLDVCTEGKTLAEHSANKTHMIFSDLARLDLPAMGGWAVTFTTRSYPEMGAHLWARCTTEDLQKVARKLLDTRHVDIWEPLWAISTPQQQDVLAQEADQYAEDTVNLFPSLVQKYLLDRIEITSTSSQRVRKI